MYHVSMTLASIKSKKEGLGMIFYFGSTGNSKYCAEKIAAATNDRIISIADALKDEEHIYHLAPQEQLGFVFPTYFMDVPQIVMEFIKKIEIQGYENQYVFSMITCNNVPGYSGERIHDILLGKGFNTPGVFSITMPGNYAIVYSMLSPENENKTLTKAEERLSKLIEQIQLKNNIMDMTGFLVPNIISRTLSYLSRRLRKPETKKFHTTDKCIGCGLCAKVCPVSAIEIVNRSPKWTKPECEHCLGCYHRCPVQAIEYGKSTAGRGHYLNPNTTFK